MLAVRKASPGAFVRALRRYSGLAVDMAAIPQLHPTLVRRVETLRLQYQGLEERMAKGDYDQDTSVEFLRVSGTLELVHDYEVYMDNLKLLLEIVNEDEDQEMVAEAVAELKDVIPKLMQCTLKLQGKLVPQVKYADKPTLIELRPGVGGLEASIFTGDLFNMYMNFANHQKWKTSVILMTENALGGLSEAVLSVDSPGLYDVLRHESGVHRVQRVPATETKGRIHTSTAAVVVLPKMSEGNEASMAKDEQQFAPGEVRVDTMRAGGKGGQHVNTTDSAVRLTHIPTGIQVQQQDERSQPLNKAKAFSILRARLAALEREKEIAEQKQLRTSQVSSTDRSDKIRTYNYPQNRVTDHRCGYSLHDVEGCLGGSRLQDIIDRVEAQEVQEKLEALCK